MKTIKRKCFICQKQTEQKHYEYKDIDVYRCIKCNSVKTEPKEKNNASS